jgi:hypothetical protein
MDWKQKIQAVRQAGEQKLDEQTTKTVEENWPKVQQLSTVPGESGTGGAGCRSG